jgi:lipopolysaccharide/colanic/teichoic acid biosynthesis glycosyltransferase
MFNNASFRKDSTPLQAGDFDVNSSFDGGLIPDRAAHGTPGEAASNAGGQAAAPHQDGLSAVFGIAHGRVDRAFFRLMDIMIAAFGIILFAPLLILVAIVMQLTSPGPLLFVQQRVGRGGVMFPCLKIRTMHVNAGEMLARLLETDPAARAEWAKDFKLRADPRITPTGGLLRKSSLDELPQLFNVLVGHMSIVGPRPIVPAEIERYGAHFADYCSVRPGLTGLWQVSGRNDISYTERVQLDRRYAASKSLPLDVTIILRTVPAMLRARGCY